MKVSCASKTDIQVVIKCVQIFKTFVKQNNYHFHAYLYSKKFSEVTIDLTLKI